MHILGAGVVGHACVRAAAVVLPLCRCAHAPSKWLLSDDVKTVMPLHSRCNAVFHRVAMLPGRCNTNTVAGKWSAVQSSVRSHRALF